MNKYEVIATMWCEEFNQQITRVVGKFDTFMNASLFKAAYEAHYSTKAEIVEYVKKATK